MPVFTQVKRATAVAATYHAWLAAHRNGAPWRKWVFTREQDDLLRRHYDSRVRGRAAALAKRFQVPKWVVNRRAKLLGLAREKEANWSQQDIEWLEKAYSNRPVAEIARRLRRTPTAVRLKAKRLGYRKKGEGYTALSLAVALGVDSHWVGARIRKGQLQATRRNTERLPQQGGDMYYISEEALVRFLKRHPQTVNLRKVDQVWFLDLVAEYLKVGGTDEALRGGLRGPRLLPHCQECSGSEGSRRTLHGRRCPFRHGHRQSRRDGGGRRGRGILRLARR